MKKIAIIIVLLMISNVIFAQLKTINGKVTGFHKFPFKNIVVVAKDTKSRALTDENGEFSIVCKEGETLIFESKSCQRKKLKVKNAEDSVFVNLVFKNNKKSREYAVGYGIISEQNLTYAVSNLNHKNINTNSYTDIYEMIKGRFAGVSVQSNNEIIIRGKSTIYGKNSALLIVDGLPVNDLSYLNPQDVKSIDVLKDASASIYGSRGANGVVLVTTKTTAED